MVSLANVRFAILVSFPAGMAFTIADHSLPPADELLEMVEAI